MFPIIPILALAAIVGGISTLVWYEDLTPEQRRKADRKAMKWFGKKFAQLSKHEQERIRDHLNRSG